MANPITYTTNLNVVKPYQNQSAIDTTVSTADDIYDAAIAGHLTLSVAGSTDVTLTDATITGAGQASNKILEFTGALTGSINVIVPTLNRVWIVYNNTSGAFNLTVKTSAGTGVVIGQGSKAIIYCDGTNVVLFAQGNGHPQNSQSAPYTLVLSDAGKQIYHPSTDTTARIWTIPANSSVAFPVGTFITIINDTSAGVLTISITTDTLVLTGAGTTGSRTLAASGKAELEKITATRWMISNLGGLT